VPLSRSHLTVLVVACAVVALAVWLTTSSRPSAPVAPRSASDASLDPDDPDGSVPSASRPATKRQLGRRLDDVPTTVLPMATTHDAEPEATVDAGPPPVVLGHLVDPCRNVRPSLPPPGFEQASADGVTVHWQAEAASSEGPSRIEGEVLAHLTVGLLERAALMTDAAPRGQLDIIVYPTTDAFHQIGGAPEEAAGFYDGSVKVVEQRRGELGISLRTLRHEVMHAQLHAGVGCAPVWLHEGAAQLFAGEVKRAVWIRMLRRSEVLPFERLAATAVDHVKADDELIYAQSLAMVVLALAQHEADTLRPLVDELETLPPDQRLAIWTRLFPTLSTHAFLDWMAQWLFDVRSRADVPPERTPICCQGRLPAELRCYAAPEPRNARHWIDETRSPVGHCRASETNQRSSNRRRRQF
jgi:hypothetical protein